jgi:hypothetical protein
LTGIKFKKKITKTYHYKILISNRSITGPVLGALLSAHLPQLGQHDHNGAIVLPQHSPKVVTSLQQGRLGGNIRPPVLVTIDEVRVNVIRTGLGLAAQAHPRRLVRQNVHQAILELVGGHVGRLKLGLRSLGARQTLVLHLHLGEHQLRVVGRDLEQVLQMRVELSDGHVGQGGGHRATRLNYLQTGVVSERVLLLCLHHVVTL